MNTSKSWFDERTDSDARIVLFGQVGVILECPSGIYYHNSLVSRNGRHPVLEGAFVAIDALQIPSAFFTATMRAMHRQVYRIGKSVTNPEILNREDAEPFDLFFKRHKIALEVDRSRLEEPMLGWVYVKITENKTDGTIGLIHRTGVFVWDLNGWIDGELVKDEVDS